MKQAFDFFKKFKITTLDAEILSSIIEKQGYTIVEFSRVSNSDDVEQLLIALGVKALSLTTGAFTYADNNWRIVFIEEGLSEDEKLILLAHEEGHIFCGHLGNMTGIVGDSVIKEHEANEFAHELIKKASCRSIYLWFYIHKVKAICISVVAVLLIIALIFGGIALYKNARMNDYCRTKYGQRYHKPDCEVLIGHQVTYNSKENFEKIGLTPCGVCLD